MTFITTFLETQEDMDWLAEVHGINWTGAVCAVLYGNEDSPERVELFSRNHVDCKIAVFEANEDGELVRQ